MTYTYRTIRIERGGWRALSGALPDAYGVWRGEIGWASDEGAIMTVGSMPSAVPGVLEARDESLEPTVRPTTETPPREDGIYAHRWFEVESEHLDEFLDLSAGAWPSFESTFGVHVIGLWRAPVVGSVERLLLITRYPSLAVWENSRPYSPDPDTGAEQARRRFVRRAELTIRTIVRVTRLVS